MRPEYLLYGAPPDGSFVPLACRALDRDAGLAFVTAWGDAPLARGLVARPCSPAMLLGRPAVDVSTVFRRSAASAVGGLDATLPSAREANLALRLLSAGWSGVVLETPLLPLPSALADARPLLDKHSETLQRFAEEVLAIKEGWLRALAARSAKEHRERSR